MRAHDRVKVDLKQFVRTQDDSVEAGRIMTELGSRLRLTRFFELGPAYRFIFQNQEDGDLRLRHRFQLDAHLELMEEPVELSARTRYQHRRRVSDPKGGRPTNALRQRLQLAWPTKTALEPFGSAELFMPFANADGTYFEKMRFELGCVVEFDPYQFEVSYKVETPIAENEPFLHIASLSYRHALDLR